MRKTIASVFYILIITALLLLSVSATVVSAFETTSDVTTATELTGTTEDSVTTETTATTEPTTTTEATTTTELTTTSTKPTTTTTVTTTKRSTTTTTGTTASQTVPVYVAPITTLPPTTITTTVDTTTTTVSTTVAPTTTTTVAAAPPAAYIAPPTPSFGQVNLDLLNGFWQNCICFFGTLLFALPLGLLISFCTMSKFKIVRAIMKTVVWCVRGTPLMLQIIVVFYAPGLLFGINGLDRMTAALIAFVINYACYFSEIYRGGIESIPKGQYEAGQVLGMTRSQIFTKIVLLQVVKRIVPPMSNEIITLIKDTSLVRVIAIADIIHQAENFTVTGLIWPLFYTAIFFLIFCGALTLLFGYIEKKLSYFN